jgi:hypothetical protein
MYIMSPDLAKFVADEALRSKKSGEWHCSYCQGREDHDISCWANHFPSALNAIQIGLHQKFWVHPVKLDKVEQWDSIWAEEVVKSSTISDTATFQR